MPYILANPTTNQYVFRMELLPLGKKAGVIKTPVFVKELEKAMQFDSRGIAAGYRLKLSNYKGELIIEEYCQPQIAQPC